MRQRDLLFKVRSVTSTKEVSYQRLDVSNIGKPYLFGILVVSQMHLLPRLDQLNGINPFVATRRPDIVKVIVYACTSSAVCLVGGGNSDQVARVIVGPEKCHRVWNFQASRVVLADFL